MDLLFEEHRAIIDSEIESIKAKLSEIILNNSNEQKIKELEKRVNSLEKNKNDFYTHTAKINGLIKTMENIKKNEKNIANQFTSLKNKVYNDNILILRYIHTTLLIGMCVMFFMERIIQLF